MNPKFPSPSFRRASLDSAKNLQCNSCGKVYKHISSLSKHLWEHTPEWEVTKKLAMTKHQQVQLLEAASILVGMTDFSEPPRSKSLSHVDMHIKLDSNHLFHSSSSPELPSPPASSPEPYRSN